MKKLILIFLAILLCGCSRSLSIETISKMDIAESNGYVYTCDEEIDTIKYIENKFYMSIVKHGKLLFELARVNDCWYLEYYDETEPLKIKTIHTDDLDSFVEMYKTAYSIYLTGTTFEIDREEKGITYVNTMVSNPTYDPSSSTSYYTYKFMFNEKEIVFKICDDPFVPVEILSTDLPEDFSFDNFSVNIQENMIYYTDDEEPYYYYECELELMDKQVITSPETIDTVYEYNKNGKIVGINFSLTGKECRYDLTQKFTTIDYIPNDTCEETSLEEFISNIWISMLKIGLSE